EFEGMNPEANYSFSRPPLPSEQGRLVTAATLPKRPPEPRPATAEERKAIAERIFREQVTSALPAPTLRTGKRAVVLDTNAVMMQFQFHVDIETEVRRVLDIPYEIIVPSVVVDELQRLEKSNNAKEAQEARLALEFAKQFRVVEAPGEGDTAILRLAEQLHAVVVTNDKILRARLRAKDIPNIHMRSKAFLTVEGHLGLR
ncbi:MAG TPA: PIN domain-containing protein, partial [Candidatus Thermoplasmatota archaeon]|nr:PIN domain-containing protein [Candidatus Thermoplasmatota archaeon]